jgi:hypothetical protein
MTFQHHLNGVPVCATKWCEVYRVPRRNYFAWKNALLKVYEANVDLTGGVWCTAFENMCIYGGARPPKDRSRSTQKELEVVAWLKHTFRFVDKSPGEQQRCYLDLPTKFELFAQWVKAQSRSGTPTYVSKSYFLKIWNKNFPHVHLRQTSNQHRCNTCSSYLERASNCKTDQELDNVHVEWEKHLDLQARERNVYYRHKEKAKRNPSKYLSIISDGMDQNKTLLPRSRTRAKVLDKGNLVKYKLQGVLVHNQGSYTYVVPPWVHETANLIVSTYTRLF